MSVLEPQQAVRDLRTILDMLRWTLSQFNSNDLYYGHGCDNAWDEAVALVLQVLYLPPHQDSGMFHARLTEVERQQIVDLVLQRIEQRVPVAYLVNQGWFCGHPFYVDERVLVPRSPFAELINTDFAPFLTEAPGHILDLCCGSGCIGIAAAYQYPEAQVDIADLSVDALSVAEVNVEGHGMQNRVVPIHSNLFHQLEGHRYDLIISNPPYVDAEDMSDLPQEFLHEPELGLAAGNDGLLLVNEILREAPKHLNPKGWLFVEVGNSLVHMNEQYPDLPLQWVDLQAGGDGIFAIQRESLVAYFEKGEV